MPTLREYVNAVSEKLGGYQECVVSLDPDPTDPIAQRSIISAELYEAEKQGTEYSGRYVWVGKYRNQRRIRRNGYSTINSIGFKPPDDGTYAINIYGFGTTKILGSRSTATQVRDAIKALEPEYFDNLDVISSNGRFIIKLPADSIDLEPTRGDVFATGGIARLETTSGFTKALKTGDVVDLHAKLPLLDADGYTGLLKHINGALERIEFRDVFPISPNQSGIYTRESMFWVQEPEQIEAVLGPAEWRYEATITPPTVGTFTVTLRLSDVTITTDVIDAEALDANSVIDAISAAFVAAGRSNPFTMVTDSAAPWVTIVTIPTTRYASHKVLVSSGTAVDRYDLLVEPTPVSFSPRILQDAPSFHLFAQQFGETGSSFYISGTRKANTWIAPQAEYGVPGTMWQDSTTGLFNDYDQAQPSLEDVRTVAYWLATQHLGSIGPQAETAYWKNEAQRAAVAAAHLVVYKPSINGRVRRGATIGGKWAYVPGMRG